MCSTSTYATCCTEHARLEGKFQEARDRLRRSLRSREISRFHFAATLGEEVRSLASVTSFTRDFALPLRCHTRRGRTISGGANGNGHRPLEGTHCSPRLWTLNDFSVANA